MIDGDILANFPTVPGSGVEGYGKFIGTCTMLKGILTLALPISIVETNFSREMASFRKKTIYLQIQKTIKRELSVK